MAQDQGVQIPRYLDSLPQILWFEVDELLGFFLFLIGGILVGWMGVGTMIGLASVWILKRAKMGNNAGYLFHLAWWLGIPLVWLNRGPKAGDRIFVE